MTSCDLVGMVSLWLRTWIFFVTWSSDSEVLCPCFPQQALLKCSEKHYIGKEPGSCHKQDKKEQLERDFPGGEENGELHESPKNSAIIPFL